MLLDEHLCGTPGGCLTIPPYRFTMRQGLPDFWKSLPLNAFALFRASGRGRRISPGPAIFCAVFPAHRPKIK
jgi:hypothetical protein